MLPFDQADAYDRTRAASPRTEPSPPEDPVARCFGVTSLEFG
jgi:hypothetical protein